jgi:anti-sigma factor RsiW
MNNSSDNENNELITRALRGQLSLAEQRELERRIDSDPVLREAYEQERALEHILERLPSVPVSSNFTSLVLQSVRAEERQRSEVQKPWLRFRLVRLATGLAVVTIAGVLTLQQYRKTEQQDMARSVASFGEVASALNQPESPHLVFRDFETIQRFPMPADSELDLELLVALQK